MARKLSLRLQFGVFESIVAIDKTGQVVGLTVSMLKKLIVGDVGLGSEWPYFDCLRGRGDGRLWSGYFKVFLALVINLGIINL